MVSSCLKELKGLFRKVLDVFPEYIQHISRSLSIVEEIAELYQEEDEVALSDHDKKAISEIKRDVLIFRSRLRRIEEKLSDLQSKMLELESFAGKTSKKVDLDKQITLWREEWNTWSFVRNDFHKEFGLAERKWDKIENEIMEGL